MNEETYVLITKPNGSFKAGQIDVLDKNLDASFLTKKGWIIFKDGAQIVFLCWFGRYAYALSKELNNPDFKIEILGREYALFATNDPELIRKGVLAFEGEIPKEPKFSGKKPKYSPTKKVELMTQEKYVLITAEKINGEATRGMIAELIIETDHGFECRLLGTRIFLHKEDAQLVTLHFKDGYCQAHDEKGKLIASNNPNLRSRGLLELKGSIPKPAEHPSPTRAFQKFERGFLQSGLGLKENTEDPAPTQGGEIAAHEWLKQKGMLCDDSEYLKSNVIRTKALEALLEEYAAYAQQLSAPQPEGFEELKKYMGKYTISFQFWGEGNNNVFIEKDDVELHSTGGYETPEMAIEKALEYLNRINSKK